MHVSEYDIAAYLEDKLKKPRRAAVESHLAECAMCAAAVGSAFKTLQMVERVQAPLLPKSVQEKAKNIVGRKSVSFFSLPARIAASILLFAGLGYWAVSSWTVDESRFRSSGSASALETSAPRDN
jgi:anti-sigma factor RsiW